MAIAPNSQSGAFPRAEVTSATKVSFCSLLMSHFVIGGFHTEEWLFWNRLSCVCVRGCVWGGSRAETYVCTQLFTLILELISLFVPLFFDAYVATDYTFLDQRHVLGLV